jgi:hypothetical protein
MGLTRVALLTGKETQFKSYRAPYQADFFNITAMMNNGLFHVINSKSAVAWSQLSPNTLQTRGETQTDCYRGTCSSTRERRIGELLKEGAFDGVDMD